MPLYTKLKEMDLVEDKKEYQELIRMRQIKIDNKIIDDPKFLLDTEKKSFVKIGILEVEL